MPTALVRNGRVVTASESYEADLYVDGRESGPRRPGPEPARGHGDRRLGLPRPAGRDRRPHAPRHAGRGATSADDFETGTRAAAFGGTTTVIDFATPEPGQSLLAALDTWRRKAEGKAVVDYGFHMAVRERRGDDARRDGPPDPGRGRHLLQALPGLSRGPAGGRRGVLPGAARRARVRGAHPRPRRERRGHRRPGEAGPGARRDGAAPPRPHAPAGDGGGGDRPGDRDGRRWPARRSTSSTSPAPRRSRT